MSNYLKVYFCVLISLFTVKVQSQNNKKIPRIGQREESLDRLFNHPPENAKPGVLWMWMGSNISKAGIKRDLESLKKEGFNRTTMFSLADVTTPWSGEIGKSPSPEIIAWTEPWWELVRFAAQESKRLGMDFGMFNCPGYESSGGKWITPEMSMQELCWSKQTIDGKKQVSVKLERPKPDGHANQTYPVYNPETGLVEKPIIPSRTNYYKDIAVLAAPDTGIVTKDKIIDLTDSMQSNGQLDWEAPGGQWTIYRFGHTSMGALIQPAQWKATGFECDKMSEEAVVFHMDHIIGEIKKHLGDLIGTGFTHVHFDSYEAGTPSWTPKMREAFLKRRGYDLRPFLLDFAGRIVGRKRDSIAFMRDFDSTIRDLYRDVYFTTIAKKLRAAHLVFLCEPYGGPWRQEDIMPLVQNVMTEFWTADGNYMPYELDSTVAALRKSGQNIVEAEAFTGRPADSKWSESPIWLKPIGDAAFCAGVNRLILHRFVQQPWDERYKPGATMGQWGTHFDRTQTWWKPGMALVKYWQRCQTLLQWGSIAETHAGDFSATPIKNSTIINFIHRKKGAIDIYFVANISHNTGMVNCRFRVSGLQPELWDPVTGSIRNLPQYEDQNGTISLVLTFEDAQSFFIVFRHKPAVPATTIGNFAVLTEAFILKGNWKLQFDSAWGGPSKPVVFHQLDDWTQRTETGIKYFSGTATYRISYDLPAFFLSKKQSVYYLDLGVVKDIARIFLNNKDLGVVWTAPWRIKLPRGLLKAKANKMVIEITNEWANRLIGDEQEPPDCAWLPGHMGGSFLKEFPDWFIKKQARPSKGRYCFTTWNYFTAGSPLLHSGLLGPVRLLCEKNLP